MPRDNPLAKKLARKLQRETGHSYTQCLREVREDFARRDPTAEPPLALRTTTPDDPEAA